MGFEQLASLKDQLTQQAKAEKLAKLERPEIEPVAQQQCSGFQVLPVVKGHS